MLNWLATSKNTSRITDFLQSSAETELRKTANSALYRFHSSSFTTNSLSIQRILQAGENLQTNCPPTSSACSSCLMKLGLNKISLEGHAPGTSLAPRVANGDKRRHGGLKRKLHNGKLPTCRLSALHHRMSVSRSIECAHYSLVRNRSHK